MILRGLLGVLIIGAAIAAVVLARLIDVFACESGASEACDRQALAEVQFAVACIGLIPALGLAVSVILGRRRMAWLLLAVAAATYAVWGVLADAAEHGWDDLKLVPFL